MNKARRHELKMLKFRRRQKLMDLPDDAYKFRDHATPCRCWVCRGRKYREVDRAREKVTFYRDCHDVRTVGAK